MLGLGIGFYKLGGKDYFPWNPNIEQPGPKGWFKPDKITSSGDGTPVTSWADSSPEGNNLSQSASENQGVLDDNALLLDGRETPEGEEEVIGDHYDFDTAIQVGGREAFILFMVLDLDSVDTQTLLGIGGASEFLEIQTNKRIRAKIDGTQTSQAYASAIFPTNQKFILTFQRESGVTGNFNVFIDGVLQTPTSQQANAGAIDFSVLGSRGEDRFLDGHIYEIIIYDTSDLTNSSIDRIHGYLKRQHSI
tara:strand:+ start:598 stop:1344 length:747 start_codon:yes stop_codon:yes gene_type:complete